MEPKATGTAIGPVGRSDERNRINLTWLVWLRWGAAAGQIGTILVVWAFLRVSLPLPVLFALILLGVLSNLAAGIWVARAAEIPEQAPAVLMLLDVGILTGLLFYTGGASNPFSTLYLVNIALAAAVLRPRWTWTLVAVSIACFGALFGAPLAPPEIGGHGGHELDLHFEGMFVAFVVSAMFIAHFVQRVTGELAERDRDLAEAQKARARVERLASLGTLAAGAAHELSTPLSTIAVIARELERKLEGNSGQDEAADDARVVREQVDRCRLILDQMSADAGEIRGEPFVAVGVEELLADSTRGLGEGQALTIQIESGLAPTDLYIPRRAVTQAVRAIAKNALEASGGPDSVEIHAHLEQGQWHIEVRDQGPGMPAEVLDRVGEPFFTTKGAAQGMGLGVFLARTVLSGLGGGLEIDSGPGRGTRAELTLPTAVAHP